MYDHVNIEKPETTSDATEALKKSLFPLLHQFFQQLSQIPLSPCRLDESMQHQDDDFDRSPQT